MCDNSLLKQVAYACQVFSAEHYLSEDEWHRLPQVNETEHLESRASGPADELESTGIQQSGVSNKENVVISRWNLWSHMVSFGLRMSDSKAVGTLSQVSVDGGFAEAAGI